MPQGGPPIESVDRALILVGMLRDAEAVSVSDAAKRLDVAVSTAHRLLAALVYRDFAIQDRDRRYRAGPALIVRQAESLTVSTIRGLAHPSLELLQERVHETVQLMVLHRGHIRFIDGIECDSPLRVGVRIGDLMPGTNFEETEQQGVSGLGVSIHDPLDRPLAAFTIAIPSARFRRNDLDDYVAALRRAATETTDRIRTAGTRASNRMSADGVDVGVSR